MRNTPSNPFASPETPQTTKPSSSVYRELFPLWTWLGVTVVGSIAISPADPISMLFVLLPSVASLWVGLGLVSTKNRVVQAAILLLIVAPIAWLAMHVAMFYPWGGPLYLGVNVTLGTFAVSRLETRRLRVLSFFTIGFLLGSFMMCLGTIVGAVGATLMAVHSSETPTVTANNVEA